MRVLFTTTRGAGHFNPLVPFARACVHAGHDVLVTGAAQVGPQAERAGLSFRAFPEPPEDVLEAAWAPVFSLPRERQDEHVVREVFAGCHARAALPGTLELIDEWGADLVVRESAEFSGAIAAERLGVAFATVGITLAASTDRMFIGTAAPVVDELRTGLGLEPDPQARVLLGATILTRSPRSLDNPPAPAAALRFSEPRDPAAPLPDWWGGSDEPLVYMSFGTEVPTMSFFPDLYRAAIEALAGQGLRVLVTIGDKADPGELGELPAGVHVERWVPQAAVMPHAAAMVGHGGSGSTLTALAWGVPMALLPLFADQPENARAVDAAGAGVVLDGGPPALAGLAEAVHKLLDDRGYAAAAGEIADEMGGHPLVAEAAKAFEEIAAGQPRPARAGAYSSNPSSGPGIA
jgi:UDP:flavonoid glycosyltransferase YjiC (YdhE family)